MHRGEDAKRQSLLRFELFRKIKKILDLIKRNILISPLEGEKKFLGELNELRNFREGYDLKYSCPAQHETVLEPSPAFVMLTGVRKRLLPLTKREGCDSVISSDFKSKISITNENNLSCKELSALVPQYLSNFSDTVFSRFTSHFSLKRKAEAGFEPSSFSGEGIDSVISSDFKSKILVNNENILPRKELSALVPQYLSNFSDTVFSRFTFLFSRKRTAFTLAEVLITLGIIGIVAVITLPTIINNYRIKVLENQFKKADSIIQQAVQKTANEYGYTSLAELNVAGCATCDNNENYRLLKQQIPEINDIWYKQFKTVKIFSDSEAYWKNIYCNSFFGAKLINTTYSCLYSGPTYKYMILADGMTVSPLFAYLGGFNHPVLIEAVFDTNGPYKGPNRLGYDIFRYETMNYNTMCNPNIVNSENFKGCYYWAHRNVSPQDSSKPYWDVLYKPLSYWKE